MGCIARAEDQSVLATRAHPVFRALERRPARDVKHDDSGLRPPIIHRSEALVPLLPRGVPNLEPGEGAGRDVAPA